MAITFDTTLGQQGLSVSSNTLSYTVTGSNTFLVVGILTYHGAGGANAITGVTYNGVAMTQEGVLTRIATSEYQYMFTLVNPATGTHDIVATASKTLDELDLFASSYAGAKQSGQPDSYVTNGPNAGSTSVTTTTTTIADNCWLVGLFTVNTVGDWIAGANTTLRTKVTNSELLDSNSAQTPAGSKSLTATHASGSIAGQMISIAPPLPITNYLGFF